MKKRVSPLGLAVILALVMAGASFAEVLLHDDFEWAVGDTDDPSVLASRNWLSHGSVYSPTGDLLYGYGPDYGFCRFAVGEGGPEQGVIQLAVSSDYDNPAHSDSNLIEMALYQEWELGPEHVGETYQFKFDAKRGTLEGFSTAAAFIKTLDPNSGFAVTNHIMKVTTSISDGWATYWLQITIDDGLPGQILQMGFTNTATTYQSAEIYYDNVVIGNELTAAPPGPRSAITDLAQNSPNPFNASTTIGFELSTPSVVSLRIYDVSGHLVRTLLDAQSEQAGPHGEVWWGRDDAGRLVASGVYYYRLSSVSSTETKSMVLVK